MTAETTQSPFESWAILELMGHRVRPGLIKEVEIAGGKMLRVDIPFATGSVTEMYALSAVYSLRPCTEEIARRSASELYDDPRPVRPLDYRERERLPSSSSASSRDDDDYSDEELA